ncbi:MAG: MazG nucleotide pyrophosphohydrolase domain-containing protein [Parcubacteria group bacterium]
MEFKELQQKVNENVANYEKNHDVDFNKDTALLKLFEEVGEFTQAVLVHQKKCRAEKRISEEESKEKMSAELADVLGMTIICADRLDIDLEKAIGDKWIDKEKK